MKKTFIILILVAVALIVGVFAFQFLAKKNTEGEACKVDKDCQTGLKCVTNVCSSGKAGSPCLKKEDCQTPFCVNKKCTEGKEGDPCLTFNDCGNLLCVNSICAKYSEKPNEEVFKEYFSRLRLGMVTEWPKEGPPPFQETNVFELGERFCTEGTVLKEVTLEGAIYDPYEEILVVPKRDAGPSLKPGGFTGCSNLPSELSAGKKYEYKIYIGDTLVAILPFETR